MIDPTAIKARLDAATNRHKLLDHPFYKAWAAGSLTVDDLRTYSAQYWRQVEAFPGYLADLSDRVDGEPKRALQENLADEIGDDHPGLWLDFARAVGASEEEVRSAPPEAETARCVEAFAGACRNESAPFALGMLYGYESQTPAVAATKIEGLRNHYGIDGPAVDYFSLHGELDVEHADELASAVATVVKTDDDARAAEAGATAGAQAIWGLLDGVERRIS